MSTPNKLPESALEFFRKKGRIGGQHRAENLTAAQRGEQARKAVQARWAKQAKGSKPKGTK
jgi:hypothetical protein